MNPDYPVSYETFRTIFVNEQVVAFGYPRTDTCSICDEFVVDLKVLQKQLAGTDAVKDKNYLEQNICTKPVA